MANADQFRRGVVDTNARRVHPATGSHPATLLPADHAACSLNVNDPSNSTEGNIMNKSPHNGSGSGLQRAGQWLIALGTAFLAVGADAASPRVVITPSAGFTILWDGNNGGFSTPDSPAPAPDNAARAASAVAFGS